MPYSDLVTQKEAAAILNRSVSAVSRAIKDGRLEYADPKNRLLHRPGLEMRFRRKTRPRIDKPQRKSANSYARLGGSSRPRAGDLNGLLGEVERQVGVGAGWWSRVLVAAIGSATSTTVLPNDRRASAAVRA